MSKNSIFIDCHIFDGGFQGTRTYIQGLYLEMIKNNEIHFFFAAHDIDNLSSIFGFQNNITYLKYNSHSKFYRLLIDIPRLIKKHKIEYAHFQYVVSPIKSCKYIVSLHDVLFLDYPSYFPFFYRFFKRILFRYSANKSDIVLTVSEYSKSRIKHHFNVERIYVTQNAVENVFFESFDKKNAINEVYNKFNVLNYFLFVSRWEPRKNHLLLLKVFVEKKYYQKYNLVFIGNHALDDNEYKKYFNSLSDEIKATVFKFSNISFQDLLLFNRGATISVYPSIAEGFGIPPLESIASEVPTVCSNTTAMADFYFNQDCFFNPLDANELVQAIENALNEKNIMKKKKAVLEKYNWCFAANQFQNALEENSSKRKKAEYFFYIC